MTASRNRIAVYPGTFDPITNGHVDLVSRAANLFDTIIVGVAESPGKSPALPLEERVRLAQVSMAGIGNVQVQCFASLQDPISASVVPGFDATLSNQPYVVVTQA